MNPKMTDHIILLFLQLKLVKSLGRGCQNVKCMFIWSNMQTSEKMQMYRHSPWKWFSIEEMFCQYCRIFVHSLFVSRSDFLCNVYNCIFEVNFNKMNQNCENSRTPLVPGILLWKLQIICFCGNCQNPNPTTTQPNIT